MRTANQNQSQKQSQKPLEPGKWFIKPETSQMQNTPAEQNPQESTSELQPGKWFVKPETDEQNQYEDYGEDSALRYAARSAKDLAAGAIGAIPDTLSAVYNIPAVVEETQSGGIASRTDLLPFSRIDEDLPFPVPIETHKIPSATEGIDKGIDTLTNHYTVTPDSEKVQSEARKMAGSVAGGGGASKLGQKLGVGLLEKAGNLTGSLKPSTIAGGAALGATTELFRESGDSEAKSIGKGALAAIATELSAKMLNPKKGLVKLMGMSKSKLKEKAIKAGEDIDVDLLGAAATESNFANQLQHSLSHLPFIGQKIDDSIQGMKAQYIQSWEKFLDKVAPQIPNNAPLSEIAGEIYKDSRALRPKGGEIDATAWANKVKEIEKLKPALVKSDPTKKLFKILEEFKEASLQKIKSNEPPITLYDQYGNKLKDISKDKVKARKITIEQLLDQRIELNKIMSDMNLFDRLDTDSKSLLKLIGKTTDDMLEKWASKNAPDFLKAFRKDNAMFGQYRKRAELESLLAKDIFNPATGESNFNALIKKVSDRKNRNLLKNSLGAKNYASLDKYVEVGKAIGDIVRRNKNKSGSGHHLSAVSGFIGSLAGIATGTFPVTALASLGLSDLASRLLTSKKFVNLARSLAKEPSESIAQKLEAVIKETTGMTASELNRKLLEAKEENPQTSAPEKAKGRKFVIHPDGVEIQ